MTRPRLAGAAAVWMVPSRSRPGTDRRVILGDTFTACDCPALRERCWHVEQALRASTELEEYRDAGPVPVGSVSS